MTQGVADVLGESGEPIPDPFAGNAPGPGASYAKAAFCASRVILLALAERVASVVPSRDFQPVLKNFLVAVHPGSLQLRATDLELAITGVTPAVTTEFPAGTESLTVALPAKRLLAILREAPDTGQVRVEVAGDTATVSAGTASWALRLSSDASDYPALPDTASCELHEVARVPLLRAVQAVRYAVARQGKPHFAQVAIQPGDDGVMQAIGCDSTRVAVAPLPGFPLSLRLSATGTPSAADELVRLLQSTEAEVVQVGAAGLRLVFRVGSYTLIAGVLDFKFPDVGKLMLAPARANQERLSVDRRELLSAIRRVRINADPETSAIGLRLSKDALTVFAQDKFGDTAEETLVAGWDGAARRLVVNHQFLTELLTAHPSPSCVIWLGKDTIKKRSMLLLGDPDSGVTGVISQMAAAALVGYGSGDQACPKGK
jgi:DNA polymerase III subunit beta